MHATLQNVRECTASAVGNDENKRGARRISRREAHEESQNRDENEAAAKADHRAEDAGQEGGAEELERGLQWLTRAADVPPVAGIDANEIAGFNEERNVDGRAGFELCRLRRVRCGVAAEPWVRFDDAQFDVRRQIDADW